MAMFFVGVDLTSAFSALPKEIDIAVLDDSLHCSFHRVRWPSAQIVISREPEALLQMLAAGLPDRQEEQVWALDGPQGLATRGARLRRCEHELGTPGRTPDELPEPESSEPFQGYIRSSIDLFSGLLSCSAAFRLGGANDVDASTASLLEVFPGAEWGVLAGTRLPKKSTRAGRSARLSLFNLLGVKGLLAPPTPDQSDALIGAYLAWSSRHSPNMVRLVGSPPSAFSGELREGMILHLSRTPVSERTAIVDMGDSRSEECDEVDPGEDWNAAESLLLLTDNGLVHGTMPENAWLAVGEDYECEAVCAERAVVFRLSYSTAFSGTRAWRCEPTIPRLLSALGVTADGLPSVATPVMLQVRRVRQCAPLTCRSGPEQTVPPVEWRSVSAAARRAAAILAKDRSEGEAEFQRLLELYPNDGMLLYERGLALGQLGEIGAAVADLEDAYERFSKSTFKQRARNAIERLRNLPPTARPSSTAISAVPVPTPEELRAAHHIFTSKEPRAVDFDVTSRLLARALKEPKRLSPTVATVLLLQSWNFAFYQNGRRCDAEHFTALDAVLGRLRPELLRYRARDLGGLATRDREGVERTFSALSHVVGKVGAAKVLHLWAPTFFPLWDTPIASAYGFDLSRPSEQYWSFMSIVRHQLTLIAPPPGVPPLKALDEYNYSRFTKGWCP